MKKVYTVLLTSALILGLSTFTAHAAKPVDSDEDGYTSNKDCNDNDPLVWVLNSCGDCAPEPAGGCACTPTGTSESICNGVDDDCDLSIDEDYASTSTNCGVGVCASTGSTTCVDGTESDTCSPGSPFETPEQTCDDSLDNDCDGDTDGADSDCGTACVPVEDHDCLTAADYPSACLGCHNGGTAGDQYGDAFDSVHYKWTGTGSDMTNQPGTIQGKMTNAMNTYCINIIGNWGVCGTCHAGRGVKPGSGDDVSNVDCLMCHNEEYALARTRLGDGSMGPLAPTDTMYQPAAPTRTNCLKCHAFGGGGNGVKRGDIANELITNTDPDYDVHMNNSGANLQCVDCHSFNGMHKVSGKGSDLRPTDFESEVSCESCHANDGNGGWSHAIAGVRGEPDRHLDKVSCQACHIPTYGKSHTETHRMWTVHIDGTPANCTPGDPCPGHPYHDSNTEPLVPAYKFWNRMSDNYLMGDVAQINPDTGNTYQTSMPQGTTGEFDGKLYPFKYKTSEAPISTDGKIIAVDTWEYLKVSGDITTSINQGVANMRAAGMTVGDFDHWGTSDTYQLITHGVTQASTIAGCAQCHGDWDLASDNMLDGMGYALKGAKEEVCGQCHDGGKKLARDHERMHGHIDKGSGIDCLYCHDFTRATSRGLCSPCDPACDAEFADTNPDYPHTCP